MKKCPYCGKEYPDVATTCEIDGEPLPDNLLSPATGSMDDGEATVAKTESYLVFPDYQWSALDAWKCAGMLIVLGFVSAIISIFLNLGAYHLFHWNGSSRFITALTFYTLELLAAAYFARTETVKTWWTAFGLDKKITDYVWFGIVAVLGIRFFGHFAATHGWERGPFMPEFYWSKHGFDSAQCFHLLTIIILAPFFEESVCRGFLYKAFRRSYPLWASMILMLAWNALTHWPQYSRSWIAAIDLSALTLLLCHLRERSESLWDCIVCHSLFNATLILYMR